MRKSGHINVYREFGSFTEILEWLRKDPVNRMVKYDGVKELTVCFQHGEDGSRVIPSTNSEAYVFVEPWFDDNPELSGLDEYFDEDDKPMDAVFAGDYDLAKFTGEEWVGELGGEKFLGCVQ